ncbi:MAG: hypothetical protein O3B76_03665 [Proteobacteria bacterium]|nr:hypothetical protein [Pseudomonadota bacterium]MDA1022643.1 hypothetical protein [Pseudomonadota bacterium]
MRNKALKATALVAALALGTAFIAAPTFAHGPGGQGGQGGGWAGGGMMGHMGQMGGSGMMGGGYGHGMMGGYGPGMGNQGDCPSAQKAAFGNDLTVESVTKFLQQRLTHMGNDRLKVGEVKNQDDKTIIAEIVTQDGSLVQKMQFDRDTGRHFPVR